MTTTVSDENDLLDSFGLETTKRKQEGRETKRNVDPTDELLSIDGAR